MSRGRIAVLGLGIMGAAMAHNLVRANFDVRVWSRNRGRADALKAGELGRSAQFFQTPAEAARGTDFVITMVSDGDATLSVMAGAEGALERMDRGAIWLQMSTVGAEATKTLFSLAQEAGVEYVDAPVLGTRQPAERGELIILAAGDVSLRKRCEHPFAALGKRTLWLDQVGDASRLKLVANQWSTGMIALVAETLGLARATGVDIGQFMELVSSSPFMAPYAQGKIDMIAREDTTPCFPLDMAHKDVRLALSAAEQAGCVLPVTTAIARQYDLAERAGYGRSDLSAVYNVLKFS